MRHPGDVGLVQASGVGNTSTMGAVVSLLNLACELPDSRCRCRTESKSHVMMDVATAVGGECRLHIHCAIDVGCRLAAAFRGCYAVWLFQKVSETARKSGWTAWRESRSPPRQGKSRCPDE